MSVRRRRRMGAWGSGAGGLGPLGLWVEPAATNYVARTTDYSLWSKGAPSNVFVTNQVVGASTFGVEIKQGSDGAQCSFGSPVINQAFPTAVVCGSVFWKKGANDSGAQIHRIAGTGVTIDVRWAADANGVPTNFALFGTTINYGFYACPSLGPGWYRIYGYVTDAPLAPANTNFIIQEGDNITVGQGAFWALPQFELGRFPTSPIPNATAGTVSRSIDNYTTSDLGALFATNAGTTIEDSTWLMREADPLAYRVVSACGGVAASGDDAQIAVQTTDALVSQCLGTLTAGASSRTLAGVTRKTKSIRLGGGQHFAHINGALLNQVANAVVNADTRMHYLRTCGFSGQIPAIVFQHSAHNTDLTAAVVNGLDAAAFAIPLTNRTGYLDFRTGLPGTVTFTRSSSALNEDLSTALANAPRFARYGV